MLKNVEINYKSLSNFKLVDLRSINLITGPNGTGKTSILQFLSQLPFAFYINALDITDAELYQAFHNVPKSKMDQVIDTIERFSKLAMPDLSHLLQFSKTIEFVSKDNRITYLTNCQPAIRLFCYLVFKLSEETEPFGFKTVLIDSVDAGLHKSLYPAMILTLLNEIKTSQVFLTTHSDDFIKAFSMYRVGCHYELYYGEDNKVEYKRFQLQEVKNS